MSHKEKLLRLYSRTYRNCLYYKEIAAVKRLNNEIGALRGVAYCLDAIGASGEIDIEAFKKMIETQNWLLEVE